MLLQSPLSALERQKTCGANENIKNENDRNQAEKLVKNRFPAFINIPL
jgi:hypothetical protein